MALNNEGNLVILSPFNEPSGAPLWKNYAPAYWNGRGSGISFDWHAQITNGDTDEPQSCWPGTDAILIQESGTTHRGYRVQGTSDIQTAANNTASKKALIIGGGAFQARQLLCTPAVAQSGFTIGFWVSPQSDGYIRQQGGTLETLARRNAIIAKGATTDALYIGVSGARNQAAQFSQDITSSGLQAFAVIISNSLPGVRLNTPIESGAYTHITMTHRFTSATNADVALFKNGRLAASGSNTGNQLSAANAQWNDRPLTIGGSPIANVVTIDRYEDAGGYGHLISGVYAYDRVLNEGEVLQIHNQGGLQVDSTLTYPTYKSVSISDTTIVTYAPFISPGYIDVSPHHLNLFSNQDEGVLGNYLICPGPFNRGMPFNDSTNLIDLAIATPSGTLTELLYGGNGSFTIAGWFAMDSAAGVTSALFDNTTLFSFGSLGTNFEFNPARQTGGFQVSASGIANNVRISARLYDGGVVTIPNTKVLTHPEIDLSLSVFRHVALAYDEQTLGIALYVDGMLAQSGAMPSSMLDQMRRLAGSGYPLVFLGGVASEAVDTYSNLAGDDCGVCDIFIAKRPLLPSEIRYIAESGIDITPLYYSLNDPRLRGYWDCTGSGTNDMIVQDSSLIFSSGGIPGHLVQCAGDPMWNTIESSLNRTQLSRIDRFGQARDSARGITSGSWAVMSASDGVPHLASATGEWSRTSSSDFCQRFKMFADERDLRAPSHINEYIFGFNVTPSGNLPLNYFGQIGRETNSMLFFLGEPSASDGFFSYLTSHSDPASGVIIVFQSSDGTTLHTPLVSGSIAYAAQSRIMFHAKPLLPYNNDTVTPIEMTLYVNGNPIQRSVLSSHATAGPAARLYDSDAYGASDNWTLQFGGRGMQDTFSTQSTSQDGLGQIYMNGIFCMVGAFSKNDLLRLAASGINSSKTISNFPNSLNVSEVTIKDASLEGYWRFSGPDAQSGTLDLSTKVNDLNAIARSVGANSAFLLRYVPLGFVHAPLPRQASGITYNGAAPAAASPPPFAISGTRFQIPQSGFSVGFWVAPREAVAATDAITLLSYGIVPSSVTSSVFTDSSWAIEIDDDSNITMILSQDGKMKLSNAASPASSQSRCSIIRTLISEFGPEIEVFRKGYFNPGHIDSLEHIAFTFQHSEDPTISGIIKGYLNGEKVAQMMVPASGFHQPLAAESRFISFMIPQTGIWQFGTARGALNSILSDVFYFSRTLGDEEVRYIALNGIGPPAAVVASGTIGGFIQGQAGAEGTIGGYIVGQDTASGIIGGYMPGAFATSGDIGGYILGKNVGSGKIGGYVKGTIASSGVIGGYMSSREIASGVIGGWSRGAIRNVYYFDSSFAVEFYSFSDFDAKFRVNQTGNADFDAQITVFQSELPPDVSIIVPNSTLSGTFIPWNQYFVGSGRALQGKSIVQAKWNFSDFTAPVVVSESGNNLYPVEHVFSQSGFYIVRFSVIDSDGQHASATRIIDLASGVAPVNIALSGAPTDGFAPLSVQFSQTTISTPNNVAIIAQLLSFDDGQDSININPTHIYTEPGIYRPIWIIRDSRGLIWSDSLVAGVNN